jgi:Rrf2 family iron-sulfur cluster assembly transcriptional regulator
MITLLPGKRQLFNHYIVHAIQGLSVMKLSTRGRYGARLMLELSKHYGKGPMSMTEISKHQGIPIKYLEQIIIPLKRARLVTSVRGPKGGHMLSRPPDEISLWDILVLLESRMALVDCLTDDGVCPNASTCPIRPVWEEAYSALVNLFKKTTLDNVVKHNKFPLDGINSQ